MDARNLHGRTEFTWMYKIYMDAQNMLDKRNLFGHTKFAWTQRISMDATLNLHGVVVELVGGGSVINWVLSRLVLEKVLVEAPKRVKVRNIFF